MIANSQSKDVANLQSAYKILQKEKNFLDSKNQKYQRYLSSIIKDKEKQDNKIHQLQKQLYLMKQELIKKVI